MSEDFGQVDPQLHHALAEFANDSSTENRQAVLQALRTSRLLIAGVKQPEAIEIFTPTFVNNEGKKADLAFSSIDALHSFDAEARPIPQAASFLARECLRRGQDALLIDLAGPYRFAVTGIELAVVAADPRNVD